MKLFTIGFTKKTAESFFTKLRHSGTKRVVDVRLNNLSQLAGFAKRNDLRFFLQEICRIDYIHIPELAPTKDILDEYKKNNGDWSIYERKFLELMHNREIEKKIDPSTIENSCLLCSEDKPHHCHRRLIAEYLKEHWGNVDIQHLW
ncbi:MAG: DUF488 domain-containing protein [Betaproteobacteria bacterium AqS2]|uniref:DUF488 domain-containing protein n=1 Tax=Candidatus Amphirhobacter heronislandensis TaxID=1732024 RepID=A0A930XVW8_9GAMM|nr:DUF488 domain-containing protein [Betaproteobacteria bacterium AqS2]